jgi:hypothetical protein
LKTFFSFEDVFALITGAIGEHESSREWRVNGARRKQVE